MLKGSCWASQTGPAKWAEAPEMPGMQIAQEEGTQGGLGQLTSSQDQVAVEGGQQVDVEGNLLVLAVGNGRQAGGGVRLCPNAGMP